jgi:hypothetical protein
MIRCFMASPPWVTGVVEKIKAIEFNSVALRNFCRKRIHYINKWLADYK